MTIRIIGVDGGEVWRHVIELMPRGALEMVRIPSFAGTEHYPVSCRVEYADGTSEEA